MLERIETRAAEIGGGLIVRRALPSRRRRTVGAWCFLDHAGPMEFGRGGGMGVGPHPHIGLQTFTWMIEGAVMHRDSLGNEQLITPGQVNLMTAGGAMAHAEDSDSAGGGCLHAVQLWIALPDAERHRAPAFRNYPHLPLVELGGFGVRVLAGSALGQTSPAEVYSPLVGLDLAAAGPASVSLPLTASFEHPALLLTGAASIEGEELTPGALLYLGSARERPGAACPAPAAPEGAAPRAGGRPRPSCSSAARCAEKISGWGASSSRGMNRRRGGRRGNEVPGGVWARSAAAPPRL